MKNNYTAVISIHGIGRHRRHANAGALLSALEQVVGGNNIDSLNTIIQVKPGIEPPRDDRLRADVPMLQLNRARRYLGKLRVGAAFRIYEVNWSPDTRARMPLRSMIKWTFSLLASTFRREPASWLEWSRLRLARLRMAATTAPAAERHALAALASAYRKYRGSLGVSHRRERSDRARFTDFVIFAKGHAKEAVTTKNLEAGAAAWRHMRLPSEARIRNLGLKGFVGLMLLGLIAISIVVLCVGDVQPTSFPRIGIPMLLAVLATPVLFLAYRFMTTVFSDVRYWSALNENDRFHETRNAVLDRAMALMRHVVEDSACVRVVIVSHSLGTAIAYDALRAIGLHNVARIKSPDKQVQIRKVDCLITMGSPIDKLAILFETTGSRNFRAELMREELRGDLTKGPFWAKGKQRIKWINFWDPADPVSDPLCTPLGTKPQGNGFEKTMIENIEILNGRSLDPFRRHTSYLNNPEVASRLFNEIFRPETPLFAPSVSQNG